MARRRRRHAAAQGSPRLRARRPRLMRQPLALGPQRDAPAGAAALAASARGGARAGRASPIDGEHARGGRAVADEAGRRGARGRDAAAHGARLTAAAPAPATMELLRNDGARLPPGATRRPPPRAGRRGADAPGPAAARRRSTSSLSALFSSLIRTNLANSSSLVLVRPARDLALGARRAAQRVGSRRASRSCAPARSRSRSRAAASSTTPPPALGLGARAPRSAASARARSAATAAQPVDGRVVRRARRGRGGVGVGARELERGRHVVARDLGLDAASARSARRAARRRLEDGRAVARRRRAPHSRSGSVACVGK